MNESPHILVVDDDRRIRELLKSYLLENDYRISTAASVVEARKQMEGIAFDLIVLDVMMPGESGLSLVSSLRGEKVDVPVLMLSALSETKDRIEGLTSGSDDYLAKPFEPKELLLRLQFLQGGVPVKLTSREKDILRILAQRPGEAFSRLQLALPGAEENERSVDVQINRLRQKIEADSANPKYLQTMRGAGYALFIDQY
jgi:two-component system, OmpR family, phosphate regulon response regulator OmpR